MPPRPNNVGREKDGGQPDKNAGQRHLDEGNRMSARDEGEDDSHDDREYEYRSQALQPGVKSVWLAFSGWNCRWWLHRPNDPSSATRRTGRNDCNHDALAGFAAAHG